MDDSTPVDGSSMGPEGTAADQTEAGSSSPQKFLTTRQAAFIGVGAMVGAGIFALLGAAGEVAGAAVWLSFLLAGIVALLQGYSFAKLGARYPSAGAPSTQAKNPDCGPVGSSTWPVSSSSNVRAMPMPSSCMAKPS